MSTRTSLKYSVFSLSRGVLYLLATLVLNACEGLPLQHQPNNPQTRKADHTTELDQQRLAEARARLSPLTLRIETDRYQSELFFEHASENTEQERQLDWLEAQLKLAGLFPAGETPGSWRQSVRLTAYRSESSLITSVKGSAKTFQAEQGVELWSTTPLKEIRLDRSEMILISSDPDTERDAGPAIDLRGKILIMREPSHTPPLQRYSWAAHQGAAALILIEQAEEKNITPSERSVRSKRPHFIVQGAVGNTATPLVMGRISAQLAQTLFGISENEKVDPNIHSTQATTNKNVKSSIIRSALHLVVKNTWQDCVSTHLVGKIPRNSTESGEGRIVFHSFLVHPENASFSGASLTNALHYSALVNSAHALSRPGETPQQNILFVITILPLETSKYEEEDLGLKSWQQQFKKRGDSLIDIHFNPPVNMHQQSFDNNEAWFKLANQVQALLEKGYVQAGPWQHH